MNFIKGYRYEMYCIARGSRTSRCVVWVDTPMSVIESFNASSNHFSSEILNDLSSRFEPPSPLTRWDTPLFRLCLVEDTETEESKMADALGHGLNKQSIADVPIYKEIPLKEIWESITETKTQAKHVAINPPAESLNTADYIGYINKITDTIVKDVLHEQTMNSGIVGTKLKVTGTDLFVVLYKRVTLLQLKNWRKQYLAIITKQQINQDQVASSFVNFINTQLKAYNVY